MALARSTCSLQEHHDMCAFLSGREALYRWVRVMRCTQGRAKAAVIILYSSMSLVVVVVAVVVAFATRLGRSPGIIP